MAKTLELEFDFRNKRYTDAARGLRAFAQELSADWDGSAKVLGVELRSFLDTVAEALAKRHGTPWPNGTTAQTLSKRSGRLIASIQESVKITGTSFGDLQGYIGAASPAAVHEYGATIKPKTAKFLTVPLPAALDSRGLPLKKRARDWDNTFVAKSRKGNLLIFQRRGTQVVPLYVLKSSVTIPPRLGMGKTLQTGIPYFVDRAMDAMVANIALGK